METPDAAETISADAFSFRGAVPPSRLKATFAKFGIVVCKGLLDQDAILAQRAAVNDLLVARLRSLGWSGEDNGDIDNNYGRLAEFGSAYAMDIIRAVKDSPFFYHAIADQRLIDVSAACLQTRTMLSVHDIAQFRIDPPHDDVRNFAWHQDFQYNVTSTNAVTVWYPLTPIDRDMGPLVVAPGTHTRIMPVEVDFSHHRPGSGTMHTVFRLQVDEEDAERQATELGPMEPGDVAFFHSLLLHRSGANRSTRCRWTVNPRFGDALDPDFVRRGWRATRDKSQDIFVELYPELVKEAKP
jgi:ectoine hydroxylase-related dioxygenase (phytanoyl-CoA dioxygenase family)